MIKKGVLENTLFWTLGRVGHVFTRVTRWIMLWTHSCVKLRKMKNAFWNQSFVCRKQVGHRDCWRDKVISAANWLKDLCRIKIEKASNMLVLQQPWPMPQEKTKHYLVNSAFFILIKNKHRNSKELGRGCSLCYYFLQLKMFYLCPEKFCLPTTSRKSFALINIFWIVGKQANMSSYHLLTLLGRQLPCEN